MATKERTETDTHCDRCDRRIATPTPAIALYPDGPAEVQLDADPGRTGLRSVDLCKRCDEQLAGWWARGRKE